MGTLLCRYFFLFLSIATPLLVATLFHVFSFFEHHPVYILLSKEKIISRYSVIELFSDNSAKILMPLISKALHLTVISCMENNEFDRMGKEETLAQSEVLSGYLPGGTVENQQNIQSGLLE
jgi:hypothetical protein